MSSDEVSANRFSGRQLMSGDELATLLGVPRTTLSKWRIKGKGPRGIRVGRYIRYRPSDVAEWIESQADPR